MNSLNTVGLVSVTKTELIFTHSHDFEDCRFLGALLKITHSKLMHTCAYLPEQEVVDRTDYLHPLHEW